MLLCYLWDYHILANLLALQYSLWWSINGMTTIEKPSCDISLIWLVKTHPPPLFFYWDPPLYLRVFLYIGHWCLTTTSLGRFYYSHLMELNFKVYDRDWHSKDAVFFFNFKKFRITISWYKYWAQLVMNPPAMQETWVWSMDWEDSPGEGKGYPLQYSGLENSMDCIVHGIAKSQIQLKDFHFHFI